MSQIHQIYIIILWFLLQLLIEINCQISPIANRPPSSSYTTLIPSSGSSSSTESNTNILDNPVIITIFVFVGIFTLIFCLYLNSEIRKKNIITDQYEEAGNYSYYPVQETVQPPAPVLLFNNDTNRNRNERNDYCPGQEIIQKSEADINNGDRNDNNNRAERNDYYPGQEIVQQSERNDYHPGQEIEPSAHHGQESIPIANDEIIQELKRDIKDLKHIILQSNNHFTSSMEMK
jgi:hypothetical protein